MKRFCRVVFLSLSVITSNTINPLAAFSNSPLAAAVTPPQSASPMKPAPPTKWKKGDQVEVQWSGDWYPAEILEVKPTGYRIHYINYESNWDEDVAPERIRPRAGLTGGTTSSPLATLVRFGGTVPEPQLPTLPSIQPRSGYVVGRAVFEDGRPIPKFSVQCIGTAGLLAISPAAAELIGTAVGSAGYYVVKVPNNAAITKVLAMAMIRYAGKNFYMQLCPLTARAEGRLVSNRGTGMVADFVLKMTGRKPGVKRADFKAYTTNDQWNSGCYGGTVALDCRAPKNFHQDPVGRTSLCQTCPENSMVVLTLLPTGPRLDGRAGGIIKRTVPLGAVIYLYGIPYGVYKANAQIIEPPVGRVHDLRLSLSALTEPDAWQTSVPVEWSPLDTEVAEVIEPALIHLAE